MSFIRTEAIITSLVFDHALRIRVKAETSGRPKAIPVEQQSGKDSKGQNATETGLEGGEDADTLHSRSTTAASTATAATSSASTIVAPADPQTKPAEVAKVDGEVEEEKVEKERKNLMGKVNNLVTSDLDNITNGRDILFLGEPIRTSGVTTILNFHIVLSVPLNITFGLIFLFFVLGWTYVTTPETTSGCT